MARGGAGLRSRPLLLLHAAAACVVWLAVLAGARPTDGSAAAAADRAALVFRALDSDQSGFVSASDVRAAPEALRKHLPGVSAETFASFIQLADRDGDGVLSHAEMTTALAKRRRKKSASKSVPPAPKTPHAFVKQVRRAVHDRMRKTIKPAGNRGVIDRTEDACIFCQFIVQKVDLRVKGSGMLPAVPGAARPNRDSVRPDHLENGGSFVEAAAQQRQVPLPYSAMAYQNAGPGFSQPGAWPAAMPAGVPPPYLGVSGAAGALPPVPPPVFAGPDGVDNADHAEMQYFNALNGVVDMALDEVCESSMPNDMYKHCRPLLAQQAHLVNLLGRQFQPLDVCIDLHMCSRHSYLFKFLKHTPAPPSKRP